MPGFDKAHRISRTNPPQCPALLTDERIAAFLTTKWRIGCRYFAGAHYAQPLVPKPRLAVSGVIMASFSPTCSDRQRSRMKISVFSAIHFCECLLLECTYLRLNLSFNTARGKNRPRRLEQAAKGSRHQGRERSDENAATRTTTWLQPAFAWGIPWPTSETRQRKKPVSVRNPPASETRSKASGPAHQRRRDHSIS